MKHQMIVVESLSFLSVLWSPMLCSPMLVLQISILCETANTGISYFYLQLLLFSTIFGLLNCKLKLN